jgi:hypothetical protein
MKNIKFNCFYLKFQEIVFNFKMDNLSTMNIAFLFRDRDHSVTIPSPTHH